MKIVLFLTRIIIQQKKSKKNNNIMQQTTRETKTIGCLCSDVTLIKESLNPEVAHMWIWNERSI